MKVKELLKIKGPEVYSISEDKTVNEALKFLVTNNIGVLLVLNQSAKISGIISERDIIKAVHNKPEDYADLQIKDIMTTNVIFVEADDEISYVESVMTGNHIRHVPVLENKVLVGLISIGDIVKSLLSKAEHENKYLQDYISGNLIG